jgi:hypothetical protein
VTCELPECQAYRQNMALRYGVQEFPCRHTVKSWEDYVQDNKIPALPRLECLEYEGLVVAQEYSLKTVQLKSYKSKRPSRCGRMRKYYGDASARPRRGPPIMTKLVTPSFSLVCLATIPGRSIFDYRHSIWKQH